MSSPYLLRETLRYFLSAKRLNFVALGALSMALMALGLVLALQVALFVVANLAESKIEVTAFLDQALTGERLEFVTERIRTYPQVNGVRYVSPADALEEFATDQGLQRLVQALGSNPLPASLRIRLSEKSPEQVQRFLAWLGTQEGIGEATYGGADADRLLRFLRLLRLTGLIVSVSLGLAAVIIVGNIIRLLVLHRREEIAIMRMVGATTWFIRGPFLVWGLVQGLAAGIVAGALLAGLWQVLAFFAQRDVGLDVNVWLPGGPDLWLLNGAGVLTAAGALLGFLGSLASVGGALRE